MSLVSLLDIAEINIQFSDRTSFIKCNIIISTSIHLNIFNMGYIAKGTELNSLVNIDIIEGASRKDLQLR